MTYEKLQTICQVLAAIGVIVTAAGGYGAWHFGHKADTEADIALTKKIDRLLPDARILHLVAAEHLNAAGGRLERLERGGLSVTFDELRHPLPAIIAHLEALEDLREVSFHRRESVKGVSLTDLGPLQRLPRLRGLNIGGHPVKNLAPLATLTELERLDADSTLVTDLGPLRNLRKLLWLNLWETPVSDLEPIAGLQQLRVLWLGETKVSDLSPIYELKHLRILDLSGPIFVPEPSEPWTATPVTDREIAALRQHLPQVDVRPPTPKTSASPRTERPKPG